MAQPSSTQPEPPQTTIAKSDVEPSDKVVNSGNSKEEAPKVQEPAAPSQSTTVPQPEPASQSTAETPAAPASSPEQAKAAESSTTSQPADAPKTTTATQPEVASQPQATPQPTPTTEPQASSPAPAPDKPAEATPVNPAPTKVEPDKSQTVDETSAAPTLPNISAAQVAAALAASQQAAPAPTSSTPPPQAAEPAKKGEPSFLYVEDDPFSREVITRLIKQNMGYPNLTVFADSSDFMARVKNLPAIPDVFLLDIQISPLNGHQMLKLLRDDATFKQSKIIALTASVMASEVKQLQDAGFDGLIGKPVMKRVFPELLQKVLDGEAVWYVS